MRCCSTRSTITAVRDSRAAAVACYRSPEYQDNIKVRLPHSDADIVIIEGYDGPQP
jgi:uncharacterized protein (DUF1330 family)